jgi:hypothetical protein
MTGSLFHLARLIVFAGFSVHFYGRIGDHHQAVNQQAGLNAGLFGISLALFLIVLGKGIGSIIKGILADTLDVDTLMSVYSSHARRVDPESERHETYWGEGGEETESHVPLKVTVRDRHYVWADSLTPIEPVEEALR